MAGQERISDRELMRRSGLTKEAVTQGKRELKNMGWLEYTSRQRGKATEYRLTEPTAGQGLGQGAPNTGQETYAEVRAREEPSTQKQEEAAATATRVSAIEAVWLDAPGRPLRRGRREDLARLVEELGFERVEAAINAAADYNSHEYISWVLFERCLRGKKRKAVTAREDDDGGSWLED